MKCPKCAWHTSWVLKLRSFRLASVIAGFSSVIGVALHMTDDHFNLGLVGSNVVDVREVVYGSLACLVGILVICRTSHAHGRFWTGSTILHQMMADWYHATSTLISFCRYSDAPEEQKLDFTRCLVRYMSLLSALIFAELEGHPDEDAARALGFGLLDVECIKLDVFLHLHVPRGRLEIVFQWVQNLIVDSIKTEVLSIPAPLLSRCFQGLGSGMAHRRDAVRYSDTTSPVSFVVCTEVLLTVHALITPVVMCAWISSVYGVALFTFFPVFLVWSLDLAARELENPFGVDASDLDLREMQDVMNESLARLLSPLAQSGPSCVESDSPASRPTPVQQGEARSKLPCKEPRSRRSSMSLMSDPGEASGIVPVDATYHTTHPSHLLGRSVSCAQSAERLEQEDDASDTGGDRDVIGRTAQFPGDTTDVAESARPGEETLQQSVTTGLVNDVAEIKESCGSSSLSLEAWKDWLECAQSVPSRALTFSFEEGVREHESGFADLPLAKTGNETPCGVSPRSLTLFFDECT